MPITHARCVAFFFVLLSFRRKCTTPSETTQRRSDGRGPCTHRSAQAPRSQVRVDSTGGFHDSTLPPCPGLTPTLRALCPPFPLHFLFIESAFERQNATSRTPAPGPFVFYAVFCPLLLLLSPNPLSWRLCGPPQRCHRTDSNTQPLAVHQPAREPLSSLRRLSRMSRSSRVLARDARVEMVCAIGSIPNLSFYLYLSSHLRELRSLPIRRRLSRFFPPGCLRSFVGSNRLSLKSSTLHRAFLLLVERFQWHPSSLAFARGDLDDTRRARRRARACPMAPYGIEGRFRFGRSVESKRLRWLGRKSKTKHTYTHTHTAPNKPIEPIQRSNGKRSIGRGFMLTALKTHQKNTTPIMLLAVSYVRLHLFIALLSFPPQVARGWVRGNGTRCR